MHFLIVADPIPGLKPRSDTTLTLVREALKRGHSIFWATHDDIEMENASVFAVASHVVGCGKDALPALGKLSRVSLVELDGIFVRKDPPFDASYVKLCWILALVEKRVRIWNRPSSLLRYHEKLIPYEAVADGFLGEGDIIPTFIGGAKGGEEFIRARGPAQVITKPFLGHGGSAVNLSDVDRFLGTDGEGFPPLVDSLVQPFFDEVRTRGDRRVLYLGGEILAHYVRLPKEGGFVSNLVQGGRAVSVPFLPEEEAAAKKVGKFLRAVGFDFAGSDMIGRYVSEVNVTSPMGIGSVETLEGRNVASDVIDFCERSVLPRKR